ncbi:cyclase family protein [Aquisalimonas sp. 2447]|uniref:cyclase family protein n=1 Tax=Aquisalimonas sp. 2447 TaxID=2740807 RepID=UPI001C2BBCB5|nr:cyclase family protein [Aquisalimonas sp. 2447]
MSAQHKNRTLLVSGLATAMAVTSLTGGAAVAHEPPESSVMERLQENQPNNWGKWGDDDHVGALNYLSDDEVLRGAQAIRSGKTFTLQIPMTHGDGPVFPGRVATQHFMTQDESVYWADKAEALAGGVKYSDDVAFMYLQGTTHVDALSHAWYGDEVYGGESAKSTVHGHAHGDVSAIGERGIVGRGVLLDVGRHMGGDNGRLAPNTCIHVDDLQATADAQGVEVESRDILVIRTGSIPRFFEEEPDAEWDAMTEPGLCYSHELLAWIDELEIPAIAADNLAIERVVQEIEGETVIIPLHGALMRDMGVVLAEILALEELAADSAEDGQYDFLFSAAPLKMVGGTGSPVNPVAIK